jgi:hypothetical protein
MNFTFKTQKELSEMTEADLNKYQSELENHRTETMKNQVSETVKNELATATENLKEFLGGEIAGQIAEQSKGTNESLEMQLSKALKEKESEIKNLYKSGNGKIEITLKAPATITTASGTNVSPPAIIGTQQAPLTSINLREIGILPYTTNLNTSLSAYAYTEAKPKDGDYSFLAEAETKPQIDLTWETNYAKPVKVAAWMKLTEESVQDVVGLESIARDFLAKKHNLKKSKGILFGNGTAPNPKGATTYGRVFSAGSLALAVSNPNFMDVVNACITNIATTHNYEDEMPYLANFVGINPNDFFIQLVSAKDGDGKPLYPTATLFNMVQIGGVTIWADESIPAGKIFVADMTKYNTTNYIPYTVTIGWVNDDFIKNQFVILGESRFHAFVKKLDEQAFIYDNIETIKTAITKP